MTICLEPEPAAPDRAERRLSQRSRVLKGAVIRFNNGYGALECVVRNRSEDGARLAFGDTSAVPKSFELKIAGESMVRAADVRWRSLSAVGVSFRPTEG
jgi:hypothetical protein